MYSEARILLKTALAASTAKLSQRVYVTNRRGLPSERIHNQSALFVLQDNTEALRAEKSPLGIIA